MHARPESGSRSRRILIAEDSSVTQDLLKLLLSQRGHDVVIVGDGEAAARRLRESAFDIALLDFHLPKRTGLRVAKEFLAECATDRRPRLVAMTADVEGLLSDADNCEFFDEIMPKPLDLHAVGKLIEREAETPAALKLAPGRGRAAPGGGRKRTAADIGSLGFTFLRWPDDFESKGFAARNLAAEIAEARLDAVLIGQGDPKRALSALWRCNPAHLLPVVDIGGRLGAHADLRASALSYGDIERIGALIESFHERRAQIHPDFLRSDDLSDKVLARIAVAGGALGAEYAPGSRDFARHRAPLEPQILAAEAEKLRRSGFLSAVFFDRLHACASCGSSRLNVREQCVQCGSADLSEEPYLHHFKCAYQGPEKDFRRGDSLICPKCRKPLAHFSVDYDKPGFLTACNACGCAASESNVAFVCIDCGAHAMGDATPTRDVFSYELADAGRAFLDTGRAYLGPAQRTLHFADLPLDLVVALNAEARQFNEASEPFVLLNVGYRNARAIEREHGHRQFSTARELFLETFGGAVGRQANVFKGRFDDFALIRGARREDFAPRLDALTAAAQRPLRLDLGVTVQAFGPEDFQ